MKPPGGALPTLATARAGRSQAAFAVATCLLFAGATLAVLPSAPAPMPAVPAFVAVYQSALVVTYALTAFLLVAQYARTRSPSLLVLGAGSLYVTLVVAAQAMSFPNVLAPGRLLGTGPDTTIWLWTFWHLGPPLFAIPYAFIERGGPPRPVPARLVVPLGWLACGIAVAAFGAACLASTGYVHLLPRSVDGDDYGLVNRNGVGSTVVGLTAAALAYLCWATRLRGMLQLWVAVALALLLMDNAVTLAGGARGTMGWMAGRLAALAAGVAVLGVYLREVGYLHARAEAAVFDGEARRNELELARDSLALALDAAEMGRWEYDAANGTSRRDARHDAIYGHASPVSQWGFPEFFQQVIPEDRAHVRATFERAAETGVVDLDCRIRRADGGAVRWVAIRGRAYHAHDGSVSRMAGIVMDTTRRHEEEERAGQAQRMEAIGQITGGVAHDFNNLLTIIVGNLDMIVRRPEDPARVARLAGSGLQAARRGAEVTEKLLAFSRRQVLRPETVNPNRLLQDFDGLLRRAVGETVEVSLDLDPALDPVRLDPGQFESAVLNLAVNARDAMPTGGSITVRTRNAWLSAVDLADRTDLSPGPYVEVSVADTGHGMDEATAAKAFEPFFTTKDVGRGTGLGLSQVYGFVRQAGGHARIVSGEGRGTSVVLYLPRSGEAAAAPRQEGAVPLRRAVSGEVVLVVEDEPAVLEMAVESLSELGYRTLTATRASEALDRLRGPDRIDIMFSDVVMPGGMNGVQLSVEARRLRPGLRVLLTSGYTGAALEGHDVPDDLPLLGKPYQREELASKLRIVLGAA